MTLTIDLRPDQEARLHERAAAARQDVKTYVEQVLADTISRPSLSELLGPLHDATRAAGVTEAEVDEIINRGRREYHAGQPADGRL